jgi:hypothetical protein
VTRRIPDIGLPSPVSAAAASVYSTEPSPSTPAPQPVRPRSRRRSDREPTPPASPGSRGRRFHPATVDDDDADAYSIPTVCRKANVGRTAVYEAINRGELIARRPGKQTRLTRVLRTDYQAWLESWPKIIPAETAATPAPAAPNGNGSHQKKPDRAPKISPKNAGPGAAP